MITVHHLENSRSQRVLWLLEELGTPYTVKRYARHPVTMLAPPELKAVHPLGKSPVIDDDGTVVAESGAIIEHLVDPVKHLKDCYGLLKPGGHMVFSTVIPGFQYHRYPIDCLRFFPDWFEEIARLLQAEVVLRSASKTTALIAYTLRKPPGTEVSSQQLRDST